MFLKHKNQKCEKQAAHTNDLLRLASRFLSSFSSRMSREKESHCFFFAHIHKWSYTEANCVYEELRKKADKCWKPPSHFYFRLSGGALAGQDTNSFFFFLVVLWDIPVLVEEWGYCIKICCDKIRRFGWRDLGHVLNRLVGNLVGRLVKILFFLLSNFRTIKIFENCLERTLASNLPWFLNFDLYDFFARNHFYRVF